MATVTPATEYLAAIGPPLMQIVRSQDSYVFDDRGNRYVDFTMGWCVGNLGWGRRELDRAAATFRGPDYVFPGFAYAPWDELARLLVSIAPGNLSKAARATGGSEAVEIALQAAMIYTGRRKFLAYEDSYHGNTLGALSVAASGYRDDIPNLLPHCTKIRTPLDRSSLERIERHLSKRDVAAFIAEPIAINLGVFAPDTESITAVQRLCRRYGTLFIADEVACGFGRTGHMFASERYGLEPDVMCLAKALSGGVAGIGAVLMTEAVADAMSVHGSMYSTYGWHPRSTAVAIAAVRYMIRHRDRLLRRVARMSEYFRSRLADTPFAQTPNLRIEGLAVAIDVGDEDYAANIESSCRQRGLLLSATGSTLMLLPALTIARATASEGLDILESCV